MKRRSRHNPYVPRGHGNTNAQNSMTSISLLTLCSVGAGLAAWFWWRDSDTPTKCQKYLPAEKKRVSYKQCEWSKTSTPSAETKKQEPTYLQACSSHNDFPSKSSNLCTPFTIVTSSASCSIRPEPAPSVCYLEPQVEVTVPDKNNIELSFSQSSDVSILPTTPPPTVAIPTKTIERIDMPADLSEINQGSRLQHCPVLSGEYKTQTDDPFRSQNMPEWSRSTISELDAQLDTDMNTISGKLKSLRRQSIDLLTKPEKRLRSNKSFPELEKEIRALEKEKEILQKKKDEIFLIKYRTLMDNEIPGSIVAHDEILPLSQEMDSSLKRQSRNSSDFIMSDANNVGEFISKIESEYPYDQDSSYILELDKSSFGDENDLFSNRYSMTALSEFDNDSNCSLELKVNNTL